MHINTGVVVVALGVGITGADALGARIVDDFEHAPSSVMQMWVGQPSGADANLGTAQFRRRSDDVLGGFRAGELEHVSSVPGRYVRISEGYVPDAMMYDGQPGSSAILRLEYSTDGVSTMRLSSVHERFLEIDVLYATLGGVEVTVDLIGGASTRGAGFQMTHVMAPGAQVMRFDLGGAGGALLRDAQVMRVTFDSGGVQDGDFAIEEIRVVPTPGGVVFGCAGMTAVLARRRR